MSTRSGADPTAIAEINATTSTLNYERELIDGGYSTLLIDQDNPAGNTLSTDTRTVLATIAGVQASVAMREPQPFTLWTIDGSPRLRVG